MTHWSYPACLKSMPVLLARGTSQVRGRPTPVRLVQWSAEEIFAVDDQGLGVFRVRGSAQAGDRLRDWSVILKVLLDESTAPMNGWSLAVREPLAYDSGLLDSPTCMYASGWWRFWP